MNTLDAAVGGSTEMASVLVNAEATETRTLLNLQDLRTAFQDEQRRPRAAAGPIQTSYELLVEDWITNSGEPGDKYDPELEALFREASAGVQLDPALMQEFLDKLQAKDPAVAHSLVNDPEGIDAILLQFPTYSDEPAATKRLQGDIEALCSATTTPSQRFRRASSRSRLRVRSQTGRRRRSAPPSRQPSPSSPSSSG